MKDKILKWFWNKQDIFFVLLIVISFIIYSLASIRVHYLFETFGWDLAVFDHGIWQWSHFQIPFSSFHNLPWLADHFHLILVMIAPFYWVYSKVDTLIVFQSLITVVGVLPIYLLAKKYFSKTIFPLGISCVYLFYISLQWHTFSGFHELAFFPITFGFMVYFWDKQKIKLFILFVILTLLVKEEMGFVVSAFGFWIFLFNKQKRLFGFVLMLLGVIYTLVLTNYLMPLIGGGNYRHIGFGKYGNGVGDVIINVLKNPINIINIFTDSPVKINTTYISFWPFAFLPLFSPMALVVLFEQLLVRFVDYEKVIRWTYVFAYSLPVASIMSLGTIYGLSNFLKLIDKKIKLKTNVLVNTAGVILIAITLFEQVSLHAPINSIFKKSFYRTEVWMQNNREVINCVPRNVSVSAQNSLAPWVSQRKEIKVFPEGLLEGYEYLLIDLHLGQSENAFFILGRDNTLFLINSIIKEGLYKVVCQKGDAMLLKKDSKVIFKNKYSFPLEIYEK